jgi:hypothetical protein
LRGGLICWLILALTAMPAWAQDAEPHLYRQVITSSALRDAGVRRLSDLVLLVNDWDPNSVDGYTWQLSPRGLSAFDRPTWSIMLDGQIFEPGSSGVRSLEQVPVVLGQIDSVVVITAPQVHAGKFVESGVIHIHSVRPRPDFSVVAHVSTANETGDPGPFRFTELATPNIDRIGTGLSGAASYAGTDFYASVAAKWQEHFVTDPQVRQRNFDISAGEYPVIEETAVSLTAGANWAGGRHSLYIGHASTKDYYFLKQYGREVPLESPYTHVGLDGSQRLSSALTLRYRFTYSANDLGKHPNTLDIDYDWRVDRLLAEASVTGGLKSSRLSLGVGLVRTGAETRYALENDDYTLFNGHAEISHPLAGRSTQTLGMAIAASRADVAVKAALTQHWRLASTQRIEIRLAYMERLPEEDQRIWFWHRRGYLFLPDNGVDVSFESDLEKSRTITADIRWVVRLTSGLQARVGAYLRSEADLALERQTFQFDPNSGAFSGPVRVSGDQSGQLAGGEVGLDWPTSRQFELGAYYRYQAATGGEQLFEDSWRTTPYHKLQATARYVPWPSVTIWTLLLYRGSTTWLDYRLADEQTDGVYSSYVSDALLLDLAIQKWLWDRRMRVQIIFRNLLNDSNAYHPIGADYGLSFAVQAELLLNALGEDR